MGPLLVKERELSGVITRGEFCRQVREHVLANQEKTLLRIAIAPDLEHPVEFTGQALLEQAEEAASKYVPPKDRAVVLLLLPHSAELFLLQVGLVLKGHIPAVLAWPSTRVDAEKYQRNLAHQLGHLPADQLLTLPRLAQNLAASLPYPTAGVTLSKATSFERFFPAGPVSERLELHKSAARKASAPEDALFLQFSGGTTGAQKAIVITAPMLAEQLKQLGEALRFTRDDSVVSWLPLYHDMGLIACFWLPLWYGVPSLQMAANDWIINPELFLKYVSRYRATICWLPNFSFSYLGQRREQMEQEHRLESVRAWINCSEPVRLKSVNEFADAFGGWGVHREALQASYAMAETVFAITQSDLGKELVTIPRSQVRHGKHAYTDLAFDLIDDVYVSSGKAIRHTKVKVVATDGSTCSQAVPGEIYVRTPSLFSGYWGNEGFQRHSLRDGWHATGDYGFQVNAEVFVIGRFKDIVIVGGNNIFPEDVEAVVNTIPGIYPGRVVAFGVEDQEYGTQSLAVVAEMKADYEGEAALELEAAIRKLVLTTIGTAPRHVAVVPARWIVKSTAGKISRRETRERFLRERWSPTHGAAKDGD